MSHRIDIELTSQSGDTWTWRAAGARQPKGTLTASLLYPGAAVGDVVRAEAEREIEGVQIVSVTAPRSAKVGPELLQMVASASSQESGGVSVQYADRGNGRREGGRGPRPDRTDRAPRGDRPPRERGDRPDRPRTERGPRPDGQSRPDRGPRPERSRPERPARAAAPKNKRLAPSRAHRDAFIDSLAVERRAIAEQLFRGGIPAVRQAIIDQNAQLRAAGQPEVPASSILAMAEELHVGVRTADWLDRADAALAAADDITIRDLRAVVTQADQAARDDKSREMSARLREALNGRVERERGAWAEEIDAAIVEGKIARALRLTARVPDPAAKLSPEVSARVVAATNAALNPQARQDAWAAMIEAAAESPLRREIVPVGMPENPGEALQSTAANASNRIPALLKLLGLTMPPPPRPTGSPKVGAKPTPPPPPVRPAASSAPLSTVPTEDDSGAVNAAPADSAPAQLAPAEGAADDTARPDTSGGTVD